MRAAWSKKLVYRGFSANLQAHKKSHRQDDSWKRKDDWTSSYHATEQFARLHFVLEMMGFDKCIFIYTYIRLTGGLFKEGFLSQPGWSPRPLR